MENRGLRLYASADNLLTFTKYFGAYDPKYGNLRAMFTPSKDIRIRFSSFILINTIEYEND